jgi:hypothetical protein
MGEVLFYFVTSLNWAFMFLINQGVVVFEVLFIAVDGFEKLL